MTPIRCFLLTRTDQVQRTLRVYSEAPHGVGAHWHDAEVLLDVVQESEPDTATRRVSGEWTDERWPTHCKCGYEFTSQDPHQLFCEHLWLRSDGKPATRLRDAPPGAMWNADWWNDHRTGADGRSLFVRCPDGHDWFVDGRAANCTRKDDETHRCWVRHGEPPNITVDKRGDTCSAGAGSIQTPKWHGFLRNGELVA